MASRSRGSQQWGGNHEFIITRVESGGRGGVRASSRVQRVVQNWCRNWKNYTVALVTLAAILWFVQGSGRRGGSGKGGRKGLFSRAEVDSCPVKYPRLTVEEIRGGRYPYLYGGGPEGCRHCKSEDHVAKFCQFGLDGFGQCWGGRREQLIHYYLQRGFNDILTFTPCDLWPMLRGRTLYFSGDSQTQDFMMAAHCFMYEFTDLGWHELGEDGVNAAKRRPGFVWHTGPGCVLLPADTRICFLRCDTVSCMMGEVLKKVARVGKRRDFLVLNFGLHFSETYREELQGLVNEVAKLRAEGEFPQLIWKDTAPQHFQTTFGEYPEDKPKPPFECGPIGLASPPTPGMEKWRLREDHAVEVLQPGYETIAEGGWRNKIANEVMRAAGVPVVEAWNETLPLWDYHRDNGAGLECTHFCMPSAPQLWVYLLTQTLKAVVTAEPAAAASA
ncbi:g5033 [Coccomyxa elongata]